MRRTYNILLDDERTPSDVFYYTRKEEYKNLIWEIVKSYDDFVNLFSHKYIYGELPSIISFDHDLVNEHYLMGAKSMFKHFDENIVKTPTGWHTLVWLINFYSTNDMEMPIIMFHTKNPAGEKNMKFVLEEYYKKKEEDKWKI